MVERKSRCCSVGRVTAGFLLSFLVASSTIPIAASWGMNGPHQVPLIPLDSTAAQRHGELVAPSSQGHEFTLRHLFHQATHSNPNPNRWLDIRPEDEIWVVEGQNHRPLEGAFRARSRPTTIQRLSDRRVVTIKSLLETRLSATLATPSWSLDELYGPDIEDKETVVNLAKMSSDAYIKVPRTEEWKDVDRGFNESTRFGWEGDGLRGHIFADQGNSTIVIAVKGTTPALFDGAETTSNDKENDNLFFGCCCGAGGHILWRKVCECSTSAFTCDQSCVVKALRMENRYYQAALHLYENVTEIYPDSQIWMTGHSLGGAVSSLLGLTFGLPVTTFEAPGEALAAARLGLPPPPDSHPSAPQSRKNTGAYHFGHTADPIFMGTCNAAMSICTLGGYAMESECHTGKVCVYDTVKDKGWRVGIGYHKINAVIDDVFGAYDQVAPCVADSECVDCFNWKFFESNRTSPTTSSSSTSSLTRTTTCHTPGWWGCLDPDETTSTSTTSSSTSTSTHTTTTTCHTPGWFGCLDPDDPTTTSTSSRTSTSLSCSSYGWFGGCLDSDHTTPTSTSLTCSSYGWFGGCLDTTTSSTTSMPCKRRGWLGGCVDKTKPHATCHRYGWFGLCLDNTASLPKSTIAVEALTTASVAPTSFLRSTSMTPHPASYPIAGTATPTQLP